MTDSNLSSANCPICGGKIVEVTPRLRGNFWRNLRERLARRYQCEHCQLSFRISIDEVLLTKFFGLFSQPSGSRSRYQSSIYLREQRPTTSDPALVNFVPNPTPTQTKPPNSERQPLFLDLKMTGFSLHVDVSFGKFPNLIKTLRRGWSHLTFNDLSVKIEDRELLTQLERISDAPELNQSLQPSDSRTQTPCLDGGSTIDAPTDQKGR